MATEKQIAANRENGKKSTGPRTATGKAKVAQNALKHGLLAQAALLPNEDGASFEAFADALLEELQPLGPVESLLADEIVNLAWRLRRASRVEAGLFVRQQAAVDDVWVREQRTKREQQEKDEEQMWQARAHLRRVYGAELDELVNNDGHDEDDQLDDEHEEHDEDAAEIDRREDEAAAARWSELGRLGFAFTRSVQQPDPFSKLNRYETSIARRLTRTRHELATLQEARDRPE
jgi:hypothetical protein